MIYFYDKPKKLDLFDKIKNGEVDISQFQIFISEIYNYIYMTFFS